jgi:hypothetical protein
MSSLVLYKKEKNMFKIKYLAGLLLVFVLLTAQIGVAAAAPVAQDAPPTTGIVQDITTETDANGTTIVLVTLLLEDQTTQTVRISLAYAVELGLIGPTTQEPVPLEELTEPVSIVSNEVISDEEPAEESVHPIAALLAAFFDEDPSIVNGYHEDGFGFGLIAQALWLSQSITEGEDASAAGLILEAKQNGDFNEFSELFEGPVPTNWGQFKKALRENKDKHNLGTVVSGQAENDAEASSIQDSSTQQEHSNGKNKDKGKNKNKNKNHP